MSNLRTRNQNVGKMNQREDKILETRKTPRLAVEFTILGNKPSCFPPLKEISIIINIIMSNDDDGDFIIVIMYKMTTCCPAQ